MQNSWRNPPLLWCPPQHQPTPPFPWMWSSTSEFRYHHSSIFKPRGFNGWIVLLKPANFSRPGFRSGLFFFSLSPLRSASAACRCPGWSVCSSFPLWTWSSLLTVENGRTPQEPTHLMGLTQHLPLHQGSTFPKHFPVKVCKIVLLMRKS